MNAIIPIARSGIFLIPGILLCERSALRSKGCRLHLRSPSRLRSSGDSGLKEAIVNTIRAVERCRYMQELETCTNAKRGVPGLIGLQFPNFLIARAKADSLTASIGVVLVNNNEILM